MRPAEQARVQQLLDEMGLINDQLNVAHRASMKELARSRRRIENLQRILDLVTGDGDPSPEEELLLAELLREQQAPE
jgi:hypothetical protein